jgi:hypothetical protein
MLQWQRLTGNEQVLSVDSDANSADQPVDRIWIECYTRALVVVHGQELKFWQQHLGYAIDTCDAFARNGRTWAWRIQVFNLYTVTKSFPLIDSWRYLRVAYNDVLVAALGRCTISNRQWTWNHGPNYVILAGCPSLTYTSVQMTAAGSSHVTVSS